MSGDLSYEEALKLLLTAMSSAQNNLPLPYIRVHQAIDLSSPPHPVFFTSHNQQLTGATRLLEKEKPRNHANDVFGTMGNVRTPQDQFGMEDGNGMRKRKQVEYGERDRYRDQLSKFQGVEFHWKDGRQDVGIAIESMATNYGGIARKYTLVQCIPDIEHPKVTTFPNVPCLISVSEANQQQMKYDKFGANDLTINAPKNDHQGDREYGYREPVLDQDFNPFRDDPEPSSGNNGMWNFSREFSFESKVEPFDFEEVVGLMSPRSSQQNSSVAGVWDSSSLTTTFSSTNASTRNSPVSADHRSHNHSMADFGDSARQHGEQMQRADNLLKSPNVQTFGRNTVVKGNLIVDGKGLLGQVHVKGNLIVDGEIRGKLVTEAGKADYAEWFNFLENGQGTEDIRAGHVVQLRSPQQKITLNTSHPDCGPLLVVSTSPSVAAGKPNTDEPGAFCAFLGQVPVKVHGPVECGDLLFPSGLNDGFAVSHVTHYEGNLSSGRGRAKLNDNRHDVEAIATAIESCPAGEHTILSFVRWQHNVKDQVLRKKTKKLNHSLTLVWMTNLILFFDYLISCSFYFSPNHSVFQFEKSLVTVDLLLIAAFIYQLLNVDYKRLFTGHTLAALFTYKVARLFVSLASCVVLLTVNHDETIGGSSSSSAAVDVNLHSKKLFVNSIHILSSVMFVVMILNLVNSWRIAYPDESNEAYFFSALFTSLARFVEMFPNSLTNQKKKLKDSQQKKEN